MEIMSYDQCIAIMASIFLSSQDETVLTRGNAIESAMILMQDIQSLLPTPTSVEELRRLLNEATDGSK